MARYLSTQSTILLLWSVLIGRLPHVRSLSNITCFTCNNCPAVTSETSRTFCSELLTARLEPYCITTTTNDGAIHRGCGRPDASFQDGCRNHTNDVTMELELVCSCDQSECNGVILRKGSLLKDANKLTTEAPDKSISTATIRTDNKSTTKATDKSGNKDTWFKRYGLYIVFAFIVLTLLSVSLWLMLDEPWCKVFYQRCLKLKVTRHQREEIDMDWLYEESITGPQPTRSK